MSEFNQENAIAVLNQLTTELEDIGLESTIEFALKTLHNTQGPAAYSYNDDSLEGNLAVIRKLFEKAKCKGIQWPVLRLGTEENITLKTNQRGQINITNGAAFGSPENYWFGRIENANQQFKLYLKPASGKRTNDMIAEKLVEFNDNPPAYAKMQSHATGACMFCGRKLTNSQSVVVGYGPVCADHYGLPWGDVANAKSMVQEELKVSTHE